MAPLLAASTSRGLDTRPVRVTDSEHIPLEPTMTTITTYAILSDITPHHGTVVDLLDREDVQDLDLAAQDPSSVLAVVTGTVSVGDRVRLGDVEIVSDWATV